MKAKHILGLGLGMMILSGCLFWASDAVIAQGNTQDTYEIKADNQQALEDKIKEAQAMGITVNTTTTVKNVTADQATQAKSDLEKSNQETINHLQSKIDEQKALDETYSSGLNDWFTTFRKDQSWDFGILKRAFGEDLSKMTLIDPQNNAVDKDRKITLFKNDLRKFHKGETFVYTNVFKNVETNRWVALQMTIENIWKASGTEVANNQAEVNRFVHGVPLEEALIVNPTTSQEEDIPQDKVQFTYRDADIQFRVNFIDSDDYINNQKITPVELLPLLYITDIDYRQAVEVTETVMDGSTPLILYGNQLSYAPLQRNDGSISHMIYSPASGKGDDANGPNRANWAVFPLRRNTGFTYTFYNGTRNNNINRAFQGLGDLSATAAVGLPVRTMVAPADITLQKVYAPIEESQPSSSVETSASTNVLSATPTLQNSSESSTEPSETASETTSEPATSSSEETDETTPTTSDSRLPSTGGNVVLAGEAIIPNESATSVTTSDSVVASDTTSTSLVSSSSAKASLAASSTNTTQNKLPKTGNDNQQMLFLFSGLVIFMTAVGLGLYRLGKESK